MTKKGMIDIQGLHVGRAALALLLVLGQAVAHAAEVAYPVKPIRVILPVPAGGTPDVAARTVLPGIASLLGQPMVVDNRGGAGGRIGAELAARAPADGYTLFVASPGSLTILPHVQKDAPYDAIRDFTPIGLISSGPFILLAHPSAQARSVKDLVALARAEPGRLTYGSAGNGSANHLAMELFRSAAGIELRHVPYKGAPQAVTDLLGGRIGLMFSSIPLAYAHVRAERLRLLGVSTARRSPQLPDVPTVAEAGVPGYEANTWFGLLGPAKLPRAIVVRLNDALVKAVRVPDIRAQLTTQGADPVGSSPGEFAAHIRVEYDKYAKVVKLSGARVD